MADVDVEWKCENVPVLVRCDFEVEVTVWRKAGIGKDLYEEICEKWDLDLLGGS